MKSSPNRTKVVARNLPPAISPSTFREQIDGAFDGRYHWVSFRHGKKSSGNVLWEAQIFLSVNDGCVYSQRNQSCSRAYIDFQSPEDVIAFAQIFHGHEFVDEKGTQYKTVVEYAPSQRIPKNLSKRDGREGSIFRGSDPEYLEFLELLAKPVEYLPSAEIQLEKQLAERTGGIKANPVITPLMEFVRHKRAAMVASRRSLSNGTIYKRRGASGYGSSEKQVWVQKSVPVLRNHLKVC